MMTEQKMNTLQANPEKLAKQLNEILPSFDELAKHDMLPRIIGLGMMLPSKRERIATAVQHMSQTMTETNWYKYYSVEENEAVVYDWRGTEHKVTMEEFEVLTKIMYTSNLRYNLDITPEQGEIYNAFKWQTNMERILN